MTILEHWNDCIPGNRDSDRPWERPCLKGPISITVKGHTFYPHRTGFDGQVFRLDVQLACGRTLRLMLPPPYPCRRLRTAENRPLPDHRVAEMLGFSPRNYSRAVTDADRLVLDLSAGHLVTT